jgi:mannose-1-phosphate guanylyltransferase
MKEKTFVAIMAGGIGSRFWPRSRSSYPKQFLDFLNTGRSLLQMTYDRFASFLPPENILIVTNEDYNKLVKGQLPNLLDDQILKEPARRNTAPCIAYAAEVIQKINPEANMIVSPADHMIVDQKEFERIVSAGLTYVAENNALLTLGIKPTRPDTGYGYIQFHEEEEAPQVHRVKTFTEKPDLKIAQTFLDSGDFLWNSGMFMWNVKTIIEEFNQHLPEVSEAFAGYSDDFSPAREAEFVRDAYSLCPSISIDYGIMEKSERVFVIPSDFGWSDVGTWAALHAVLDKDDQNNAVSGKHIHLYDSEGNMVSIPDQKLAVLVGLKGFGVIDTEDVLVVFPLSKEQEIKPITNDLKKKKLDRFM